MMTSEEYAKFLKTTISKGMAGWKLTRIPNPDEEYEKRKILKTLELFNRKEEFPELNDPEHRFRKTMRKDKSFSAQLAFLAECLLEDIESYTEGEFESLLSRCSLTFLPTGMVDGFCLAQDDFGEPLNGHLICINEGLYFCLQLIAKALVLENLQGDYACYWKSGAPEYKSAIDFFLTSDQSLLNGIFFKELPAEVNGEVSSYQSSIAMMVLQFVVLHEFGHIVHNDFELMGLYRFHIAQSETETLNNVQEKYWQAEYAADEFALKRILSQAKSIDAAWSNFYAIYAFFHWLADVEKQLGKSLCPYHPNPIQRAERLRSFMAKNVEGESQYEPILDWVPMKAREWFGMKEIDQ